MLKTDTYIKIGWNKLIISIVAFLGYASLFIIFYLSKQSFENGFNLFSTGGDYTFIRYLKDLYVCFCGSFILFLLPGLFWVDIFAKEDASLYEILFYSFLISLISMIIITTLFKLIFSTGLNSSNFLLLSILINFIGIVKISTCSNNLKRSFKLRKTNLIIASILAFSILAIFSINKDVFMHLGYDNNFTAEHVLSIPLGMQDDMMEIFGLTDSLKNHFLPFWDLEYADKFGYSAIDPPLLPFIYLFLNLFFGQSLAVPLLTTLTVIMLTYFFCWKIASKGIDPDSIKLSGFLIPVLFICYISVLFKDRLFAIALCDYVHFMVLFTILQLYFLANKRTALFLTFAILAFFIKYEAMIFTLFGLIFYQAIFKPESKTTLTLCIKYLCAIMLYFILIVTINSYYGDFEVLFESFVVERFVRLDYFGIFDKAFPVSAPLWPSFSLSSTFEFVIQYLLATIFLGLSIFIPQKDDKNYCFYRSIAIAYLVLVLVSRIKRIHYISPLVFLSTITAFRLFIKFYWSKTFNKNINIVRTDHDQ